MLFVIEYTIAWTELDTVLAKRLEWEAVKPPSFRYVGEWVWQQADPPFRGMAVVEAEDVDSLNAYVLHYGPSVKVTIHPATDVPSAMKQVGSPPTLARAGARKGSVATGRSPAPAAKEKRKH